MFVSDGGKSGGLNYNICKWGSGESFIITWWEENNVVFISFNSGQWRLNSHGRGVPWCTAVSLRTALQQPRHWDWEGPSVVDWSLPRTDHAPHHHQQLSQLQPGDIISTVKNPRVNSRPPLSLYNAGPVRSSENNNVPGLAPPLFLSSRQLHSFVFWSRLVELHKIKTPLPPPLPGHRKHYSVSQSVKLLSMIWWGQTGANICYLIPLCHFLSIYKLKQKPANNQSNTWDCHKLHYNL